MVWQRQQRSFVVIFSSTLGFDTALMALALPGTLEAVRSPATDVGLLKVSSEF